MEGVLITLLAAAAQKASVPAHLIAGKILLSQMYQLIKKKRGKIQKNKNESKSIME